jgi:hypothetical protein
VPFWCVLIACQHAGVEMSMAKATKPEVTIAVWANRDKAQYFGWSWPSSLGGYDDNTGCWISLRGRVEGDKYAYMSDSVGLYADIGVYVWVDRDGTMSIEPRIYHVHSVTISECEVRLKALKALHAKASKRYPVGCFVRTRDVFGELVKFFDALGVQRATVYHGVGQDDTTCPVSLPLRSIAAEIEEQIKRLGGWKEQVAA